MNGSDHTFFLARDDACYLGIAILMCLGHNKLIEFFTLLLFFKLSDSVLPNMTDLLVFDENQ